VKVEYSSAILGLINSFRTVTSIVIYTG